MSHISVLLKEVLEHLKPLENSIYVDCTFGAGGHTRAILESTNCKVIAFDRDPTAIQTAEKFKEEFGIRFEFIHDRFGNIAEHVTEKVDGIVADFGISSMQVDNGDRGFSFQKEARLDMRMGKCEISAFEVVNNFDEKQIADIIFNYSNEHLSKKIASMIFTTRKQGKIETTTQLAEIIFKAYNEPKHYKIHPATKTFQAIRIFVNQELKEIEDLLSSSLNLLKPSGRLVCVSFHELEDRLMKNFFAENSQKRVKINKYAENNLTNSEPLKIITQKPIEPSDAEVKKNPRSRSAKLRCAEKL